MGKRLVYFIILLFLPNLFFGQKKKDIELATLYRDGKIKALNRAVKIVSTDSSGYINVSEDKGEGVIWLPVKQLKTGTIKIEMRGKDVLQQSFIGVIFHGQDDSTYDAVYCRPFNFFAKDSVRRIHAIQYISHPFFTWKRLREEQNAVFEKEIVNPPDPNGWFTLKVVIDKTTVKAFINKSTVPSLVVNKLSKREGGKIGLFTGDGSGGDFKKIQLRYKK
jgi:hypothetical protein